jgi:hypothetical protein
MTARAVSASMRQASHARQRATGYRHVVNAGQLLARLNIDQSFIEPVTDNAGD